MKKKILIVFGTRPEAIKMVPVIKELKKYPDIFESLICVTGQHREMLDQVLDIFDVKPDFDLNIMESNQDLFDITSKILLGMKKVLSEVNPDLVLVHGDTTTSMATSLSSFYSQIPVGHVEAGLRTRNIYSPWPEEINRQITGRIAEFHFSPTEESRNNLLDEKVNISNIFKTGNTVIDTLYFVLERLSAEESLNKKVKKEILAHGYDLERLQPGRRMVLITGHRRENFGQGFLSICNAIKTLSQRFPNVDFVYPMHLNPNVRKAVKEVFGDNLESIDNLFLIEPLEYLAFVMLMSAAHLILTDSGGIQEEAPGIGKPVLVMRETTERPEAVKAGTVKLVGTDKELIVSSVAELLTDEMSYQEMSAAVNPYGDGKASIRIVEILRQHFGL